ncbi:hypothetical protein NWE50_04770 [Morganella morganii]|nr:hypothetical protein [Morganella morganii]
MTNYICAFNPIDSALKDGAVTVAITISANSEKMARAMATVMLEETYPENTGKFDVAAPIICEAQAGKPARPAIVLMNILPKSTSSTVPTGRNVKKKW